MATNLYKLNRWVCKYNSIVEKELKRAASKKEMTIAIVHLHDYLMKTRKYIEELKKIDDGEFIKHINILSQCADNMEDNLKILWASIGVK